MKPNPMLSWMPAIFCTFLSLMALFGPEAGRNSVFYSFLPICFLFAGFAAVQLRGEVSRLRRQIEDFQQRAGEAGPEEA